MLKNKWLKMLIALVISIGLWVYVVTVENPVKEIEINNIPVSFYGQDLLREDYDLLLTDSNVASGVTLTFSGKLSDLNKLQENKSDLQISIDITHLRKAQTYQLPYSQTDITFPSAVSPQDVDLNSKKPNMVSLTLEKLSSVPVPVKVQQDVDLLDNYLAGRLSQNYTEIFVEGPEELVKQISYAQAILDRENVDQTITATLPLTLIDQNGEIVNNDSITYTVTEVEVTLPILMYKDVPLEIPIIYGGGISEADVVVEASPKTIRLSGDPALMESIQSIKLSNIDVASLMTNSEILTREIVIPEGTSNVSGEVEASVNVEIKNKAIRMFRVSSSNFQYVGLPADQVPNSRTTVIQVAIRANKSDIDKITEDNIRVVADFTGKNLTKNMTMEVSIFVDGYEGAGVIAESEYSILVDVVPVSELTEED